MGHCNYQHVLQFISQIFLHIISVRCNSPVTMCSSKLYGTTLTQHYKFNFFDKYNLRYSIYTALSRHSDTQQICSANFKETMSSVLSNNILQLQNLFWHFSSFRSMFPAIRFESLFIVRCTVQGFISFLLSWIMPTSFSQKIYLSEIW